MKIKILKCFRSTDGNYNAGDEVNLSERVANSFIAIGYAEKLEEKKSAGKKKRK